MLSCMLYPADVYKYCHINALDRVFGGENLRRRRRPTVTDAFQAIAALCRRFGAHGTRGSHPPTACASGSASTSVESSRACPACSGPRRRASSAPSVTARWRDLRERLAASDMPALMPAGWRTSCRPCREIQHADTAPSDGAEEPPTQPPEVRPGGLQSHAVVFVQFGPGGTRGAGVDQPDPSIRWVNQVSHVADIGPLHARAGQSPLDRAGGI